MTAGFAPDSSHALQSLRLPGGAPDHHDQAGVGVDDNLVVGGVPIVLRLRGVGMSRFGTRVPFTLRTVFLANCLRGWSASIGPR